MYETSNMLTKEEALNFKLGDSLWTFRYSGQDSPTTLENVTPISVEVSDTDYLSFGDKVRVARKIIGYNDRKGYSKTSDLLSRDGFDNGYNFANKEDAKKVYKEMLEDYRDRLMIKVGNACADLKSI